MCSISEQLNTVTHTHTHDTDIYTHSNRGREGGRGGGRGEGGRGEGRGGEGGRGREGISYLCVVIHKDSNVVSIGDGTVREMGSGPHTMHVHTRATERGVCEVAVVDERLTRRRYIEAVEPTVGNIHWSVILSGGGGGRGGGGGEGGRGGRGEGGEGGGE